MGNSLLKIRVFVAACLLPLFALPRAEAQVTSNPVDVALLPAQYEITRLVPGAWTGGLASFHVDAASGSRLWFRIRASSPLVHTWIQPSTPPDTAITPDNVGDQQFSGTYMAFLGGEPGPFILPTNDPGYQYIYDFLSQGPGQYTMHLLADRNITADVAVITELLSESPVAVNLIAVTPEVALGETAVLTAAVFEGPTTCSNSCWT